MTNIQIDPEFKALIPPLAPEELAQLEANIIKDGCRDPLVVWQGVLIDGHNRHEICTRNGIEFAVVEMEFESRAHVRIWMRENQKGRRNLSPAWLIEMQLGNKADLLEIGRSAMAEKKTGNDNASKTTVSQNDIIDLSSPEPVSTRATIAKAVGVSTGMIGMAEQVKKKAPDLWEKAKAGDVSISTAYKEVKNKEKLAQRHHDFTEKTKAETKSVPPIIQLCDCINWLNLQEVSDLLITDPPYSTDVEDINVFAAEWLPLALSKVKSTGRAYVCVGAYPEELAAYMRAAMPTQILVWTYRNTLGPSPSHSYKLNWQAILYYQMPDAAPLRCPIMLEQFSVQDINAPDGRLGDRYHAWQKPMQLAERLIRHSTDEGDSVIDPFACTGTFLLAASSLGRVAKGCEIDAENLTIAINRGCVHE